MTDSLTFETTDTVVVDPLRPTETICPQCWLVYNAALRACPTPDCE